MSLNVIVTLIAAVVFVFLLFEGEWTVRRHKRVLGRWRYSDCIATTKMLGRFSGRIAVLAKLKWVCLLGGMFILLYQLLRESSLLLMLAVLSLLVTGLAQWGRERIPASILVLGSSGVEQISLQAAIRDAVLPFRPVSFLQTDVLRIDVKISGDCFRIDRGVDWRDAVFAFCRSVPLIVLDIRNITPLVRDEIEHVFKTGHTHKTLFIGPEEAAATLEDAHHRAASEASAPAVLCLPDTEAGVSLIRYILLEREAVPTPEAPISSLSLEWREWPRARALRSPVSRSDGFAPSRGQAAPASESTPVRCSQLAPFSYQTPPGWQARVLIEDAERYAVLFRPPEESGSGLRGLLSRRSRLDLTVFKYTDETISDEAALRRATEVNLTRRGASITRERVGRRCGAMSHECFFQRGASHGYLVRFITRGNEYLVHWTAMDGPTMRRHMPSVEEFIDRLKT